MKLYDKKFLIYGNYMIRSFGQPGRLCVYKGKCSQLICVQNFIERLENILESFSY